MIKIHGVAALWAAGVSLAPGHEPEDSMPRPGCAFTAERIAAFADPAEANGHRAAVDAGWLTLPVERDALASMLAQEDRASETDAPFGMAYNAAFAAAIEALSDEAIDRLHADMTQDGPIACAGLDTGAAPFADDIIGVQRWAEAQMIDPDPDAPPAVETLSLSRPAFFDSDRRVLVAEAYSFTPIPISRPPSALIGFTVYRRDGGAWVREAGIILQRMG